MLDGDKNTGNGKRNDTDKLGKQNKGLGGDGVTSHVGLRPVMINFLFCADLAQADAGNGALLLDLG